MREPTLSAIKKSEDSNSTHEILNEMVKCGSNTVLLSPAHWQTDINLETEDVNLLFGKFTYDYFKNASNELRTKETLLSTWNKLIKSKQQIELCIKYLPSVPICICNHNNNNVLVFCDACKYWCHPTCMHVNTNFNSSFPFDFYVCPCCIFRKFGLLFGYLSLSSVTLIDGNKETLKNAFIYWKSKSEEINKNKGSYQKPNSSTLMHLPTTNDITTLSKTGVSNYYNSCYMSVIIHSILGTVIALYIPIPSNISSPVLKAFDECKKKVTCQMVKRFKKRKTGINFSKQFKTFSECLMNSSLKLKEHHDAIGFF